jgi:putative membrane protein
MKDLLALAIAGAAFSALSVSAQAPDEQKFVTDAIRGNIAEVKVGELAQQRGQSKEVREYGEMLSKDHSKSLQKSNDLAKKMGVAAPTEPTAQQQQKYEALSKLSGTEFDTTFLSQMVRDHQEEIAKFSSQAQSGSKPEVSTFAQETLPTLRMHLEHAQSIQKDLMSSTQHRAGDHSASGSSSSSPAARSPGSTGREGPAGQTGSTQGAGAPSGSGARTGSGSSTR